jgi:hypothetical protein
MSGLYPITAPASGAYPLSTSFSTSQAASDVNNTNDVDNYAWGAVDSAPVSVRVATTGSETYALTSGSVTTINGTTIDGVSVAVNDAVLIKDAPASSGTGSPLSSQPGNGLYYVTAVATNISLSRAATMSPTGAQANPAGRVVYVRAGTANALTQWMVKSPNGVAAFTYGTTAMQWGNYLALSSGGVPNTSIQQAGINNFNTALQSQSVVSGTAYYITNSNLQMPATALTGMTANRTAFVWNIAMTKNAAGTGTFQIAIYRGTNGTTADTQDVLATIGTQTAVIDEMMLNIQLVVTTTGASGAYYYSIIPDNRASVPATAAGFGVPGTGSNAYINGTKTSVAMNTAGLQFGIGFVATTGIPIITVPMVQAFAYNMD